MIESSTMYFVFLSLHHSAVPIQDWTMMNLARRFSGFHLYRTNWLLQMCIVEKAPYSYSAPGASVDDRSGH